MILTFKSWLLFWWAMQNVAHFSSYLVKQICIWIRAPCVRFHAVLTCNQIWFTMSLLGAQLEEFQGGIFIPDEETLMYCVFPIFYTWQYYENCNNIVESFVWDDQITLKSSCAIFAKNQLMECKPFENQESWDLACILYPF